MATSEACSWLGGQRRTTAQANPAVSAAAKKSGSCIEIGSMLSGLVSARTRTTARIGKGVAASRVVAKQWAFIFRMCCMDQGQTKHLVPLRNGGHGSRRAHRSRARRSCANHCQACARRGQACARRSCGYRCGGCGGWFEAGSAAGSAAEHGEGPGEAVVQAVVVRHLEREKRYNRW